jgi:hypothetical protein
VHWFGVGGDGLESDSQAFAAQGGNQRMRDKFETREEKRRKEEKKRRKEEKRGEKRRIGEEKGKK